MAISAGGLILCHGAYAHRTGPYLSLFEIFEALRATRFPTAYFDFFAFARLVGDPLQTGEVQLRHIFSTTGEMRIVESSRVQLRRSGTLASATHVAEFRFTEPGMHIFQLTFDDEVIAEQSLLVMEKEP